MDRLPILIANDHGGYALKTKIVAWLEEQGIPCEDLGCDSEDIVRYPYYAAKVAGAIAEGRAERGILICSTGIGMSIAANRYKGVRASLCTSVTEAVLTRAHPPTRTPPPRREELPVSAARLIIESCGCP